MIIWIDCDLPGFSSPLMSFTKCESEYVTTRTYTASRVKQPNKSLFTSLTVCLLQTTRRFYRRLTPPCSHRQTEIIEQTKRKRFSTWAGFEPTREFPRRWHVSLCCQKRFRVFRLNHSATTPWWWWRCSRPKKPQWPCRTCCPRVL